MPSVLLLLFFLSVFLIFYTYVGFPLVMKILASGRGKNNPADLGFLPSVSVVMSVYNEEKVIAKKLEGLLKSVYAGAFNIYIGSDSSTDQTNSIVAEFAAKDSRIHFAQQSVRRGKPAMINDLIAECDGEIIILTDANVFFETDTIEKLVQRFVDPSMGLAGATIYNSGVKGEGISHQEKSYIQRENMIKYYEGEVWGTMMGPFGGCYALRKNLFEPVPVNYLVDDFYISMIILEKGYKCVNAIEAICYEDVSSEVEQEYRRKARISAGNFQNLNRFRKFIFRPFSAAGFCFISHKVIRWFTPFLILVSYGSLAFLISYSPLFRFLFFCQTLLLISPLLDYALGKLNIHFRLLRFVSYFTLMNVALLKGFFRYLGGVESGVWTPTKRVV